ncbi:TetR/AcrR family transcriptional regulator [Staphylococcus nepalensis]|uniref:TetR/AcrR family transcriptional regulator n=1 Tax=Staphylococcus nepalensis TaxID=214473 RepID=UPI0024B89DB9|nr:TetR/AcrR family transcriptional regulator [Staphylococcus nepalensis]
MNDNDLRVIKTKRALTQSFFQLLKNKEFSDITVKNICSSALIHRTTFYQHFFDKYDLLVHLISILTKDFFSIDIQQRLNNPFLSINDTINNIDELKIIKKKQSNDKEFERTTKNHFIQLLQNDILENQKEITAPPGIPIELIFYIYGAVLAGFIEWLQNSKTKIDKDSKKLDALFHKTINIHVKNNQNSEQIK